MVKNNLFSKNNFYKRVFWIIGVILMLFLPVFYFFQVNAESSERYLVQKYERELNRLMRENKNLMINSAQINSLDNLAKLFEKPTQSQALNFKKVNRIHYIQILDTQLVTR